MIAKSEVASASCWPRPTRNTSPGTNRTPPPTPSMPAITPAAAPIAIAPAVIATRASPQHQLDGAGDEYGGEQQRARTRVHALLKPGPGEHAGDRRDPHEQPPAHVHVSVQALRRGGEGGGECDRSERGTGGRTLVVAEPEHEQRDDHRPTPDAEQTAEETRSGADREQ